MGHGDDRSPDAPAGTAASVQLRGIVKQFGAVEALRGVDLDLRGGEVHALVGENGAGKSTVVKILAGVHRPDLGEVRVDGEPVVLHAPADARDRGIAVIYQQPTLFPDLDVAENVFMGRHPRGRLGRVDWPRMYREVEELLANLGVRLNPRIPVQGLSVADQQLVEIAKALSLEARVLVMDEPTAALSVREVDELFEIVRQLRDRGVAVLFVSHRLDEVFALADRVTVLRDGAHVVTALAAELTADQVVRYMVGRQLDALFPKEAAEIGETVLEVRGLSRVGAFQDISFELRRGEILGCAGLVGAGRTELARALFGIDHPDAGSILVAGRQVEIDSPAAAMARGIAYVPEDRHRQGLVLEFGIADNVVLPILGRVSRRGILDRRRARNLARDYTERLRVRMTGLDQLAGALSGGNQQKVVLAKWLTTDPKILLLDEPTRGIDIGAKAEVHRIISSLAADGLAILLISSELPEVLAASDRVLVFHQGRLSGEFARAEATEERLMFAATGQVHGGG
jgi:rhamnose transport system ATP-binding protein